MREFRIEPSRRLAGRMLSARFRGMERPTVSAFSARRCLLRSMQSRWLRPPAVWCGRSGGIPAGSRTLVPCAFEAPSFWAGLPAFRRATRSGGGSRCGRVPDRGLGLAMFYVFGVAGIAWAIGWYWSFRIVPSELPRKMPPNWSYCHQFKIVRRTVGSARYLGAESCATGISGT